MPKRALPRNSPQGMWREQLRTPEGAKILERKTSKGKSEDYRPKIMYVFTSLLKSQYVAVLKAKNNL